jgi:hypothetical protein
MLPPAVSLQSAVMAATCGAAKLVPSPAPQSVVPPQLPKPSHLSTSTPAPRSQVLVPPKTARSGSSRSVRANLGPLLLVNEEKQDMALPPRLVAPTQVLFKV